jgi:hypothetical protein
MFYRVIVMVAILVAMFTASSACAGDSWWSSPFKSKPKTSETPKNSQLNTPKKEWTMPDPNAPEIRPKKSPSMISKMGTTTKAWWKKTCEILAPYPTDSSAKNNEPETVNQFLEQESVKF